MLTIENVLAAKNTPDKFGTALTLLQNDLVPFIGANQRLVLTQLLRGEEREWFADKILEIAETIKTMPISYQQDGMGDDAVAFLHYFVGNGDWWITEKDMTDGVSQAFGYADLRFDTGELGYISITEILANGGELDLHWTETKLGDIKAKRKA